DRDPYLPPKHDGVASVEGAFREEHAVVGDDAYRISHPATEAADQRGPIARLEFVESAPVQEPRQHFPDVVRLLQIGRQQAVNLVARIDRVFGLLEVEVDALYTV